MTFATARALDYDHEPPEASASYHRAIVLQVNRQMNVVLLVKAEDLSSNGLAQ